MRRLASFALIAAFLPGVALADIQRQKAQGDVPAVMDALVGAVEGAGATVFARVDHGAGAKSVGMDLEPAQLLIFGNPKLGTPAMQDDVEAGLALPLRVLVYEKNGQTWIAYEEVEDMFDDLDIDENAAYVKKMEGALKKLTAAAANGE